MNQYLRLLLFTLMALSLGSCLMPNEKGKVSLELSSKDQAARNAGKAAGGTTSSSVAVTQIQLINDQIKITGSDLAGVNKVKLTQGGTESVLSIVSQSANQLLLSAGSQIVLGLNTLMSLTLEDTYGATVVSVTFNLPDSSVSTAKIGDAQVTTAKIADGAITAVKLASMGAGTGQILKWNGSAWVASDFSAMTYAGTWDASIGGNPNVAAVGGEYYIVSAAGTADPGDGNSRTWAQGDWIVYNATTSAWDQISNSSDVTSFNGRTGGIIPTTGDYTWAQINKTTSSVGDIADVDLTTAPTSGQVLKFNGTSWIPGTDNNSGVTANSVTTSSISDGTIVDADVSASAAIAWGKIDKTGAAAADVGLGNVTNVAQMPLSYLDTTTNLGTSNVLVPSQNAVKSYVDSAVTGMGSVTSVGSGAGLTGGPITTTGTLAVSADGTTINFNGSNAIQVANGAITDTQVNAAANIAWSKINKTGATGADVGLGNVTNVAQMPLSYLDTTTTLGTSNVLVPSQNAVKSYVDSKTGAINASQWTTTGTDIYYNSGNVGIGVLAPASLLDIEGRLNQTLSGTVDVTAGSNAVTGTGTSFSTELSVGDAILIGTEKFTVSAIASNTALTLSANHVAGATGATGYKDNRLVTVNKGNASSAFVVTSSGKVGMGTSSPAATVHLYDPAASLALRVESGAGDANLDLYSNTPTTGKHYVLQSIGSNGSFRLRNVTDGITVFQSDASGNLGVGTTDPHSKIGCKWND